MPRKSIRIASDVKYLKKETPTRYRYKKKLVKHKGKKQRERLGFKNNKVVEIGFVKPKKRLTEKQLLRKEANGTITDEEEEELNRYAEGEYDI